MWSAEGNQSPGTYLRLLLTISENSCIWRPKRLLVTLFEFIGAVEISLSIYLGNGALRVDIADCWFAGRDDVVVRVPAAAAAAASSARRRRHLMRRRRRRRRVVLQRRPGRPRPGRRPHVPTAGRRPPPAARFGRHGRAAVRRGRRGGQDSPLLQPTRRSRQPLGTLLHASSVHFSSEM